MQIVSKNTKFCKNYNRSQKQNNQYPTSKQIYAAKLLRDGKVLPGKHFEFLN